MTDLVAVYPDPPPPELARTLDLAGYRWKAVGSAEDAIAAEPLEGWAGAVVAADADPDGSWPFCRAMRSRDARVQPLLLLVTGGQLDDAELSKLGIAQLPYSLADALRVMEESSLVAEALGEHIFEWFLRNKRSEWMGYKTSVTPYELNRYLRSL